MTDGLTRFSKEFVRSLYSRPDTTDKDCALVGHILDLYANGEGFRKARHITFWPSVASLATKCSERAVQYRLRRLEALGIIALLWPGNGRRNSALYELLAPGLAETARAAEKVKAVAPFPEKVTVRKGAISGPEKVQAVAPDSFEEGLGRSRPSSSSSSEPHIDTSHLAERACAAEEPAAPLSGEGFQKMNGKESATLPETVPDEWMRAAQLERHAMKLDPLSDVRTVAAKFLHHMRAEGRTYRDWRARWIKWALDERPTPAEVGAKRLAETLSRLEEEEAERNRQANRLAEQRHAADVERQRRWDAEAPARAEAEKRRLAEAVAESAKRAAERRERDAKAEQQRREAADALARQQAPQLRVQRIQNHVFARYGLDKGMEVLARFEAGDVEAVGIIEALEVDVGLTPKRKAS